MSDSIRIDQIIAFEQGELDEEGVIELFQTLVNTGMAWKLQGSYGRTAAGMLEAGLIFAPDGPRGLQGLLGDVQGTGTVIDLRDGAEGLS